MKTKYIYNVTEQSVDVRNFTIETDKPLQDDCGDDVLEAICMVSITKKGDEETGTTEDGVNYKVTYVDTDYGDDSQMDWNMVGDDCQVDVADVHEEGLPRRSTRDTERYEDE